MHALFFMSDSLQLEGVENRSIHIFESEEAADQWLFEKLIEAEVVDLAGNLYEGVYYETIDDLLDAVRDRHGSLEFMDVFPAVDHR